MIVPAITVAGIVAVSRFAMVAHITVAVAVVIIVATDHMVAVRVPAYGIPAYRGAASFAMTFAAAGDGPAPGFPFTLGDGGGSFGGRASAHAVVAVAIMVTTVN